MALGLKPLHLAMVRQFHTVASDTRFQEDFIQAVNLCLDELSFVADLATPMTHVATFNGTCDDLDEEQSYILFDGLVVKLIEMGREHPGAVEAYARATDNWTERKGDFAVMQSRTLQATEDDDGIPSSDIIGLGYLGDE